jgi:hypothetical protein
MVRRPFHEFSTGAGDSLNYEMAAGNLNFKG